MPLAEGKSREAFEQNVKAETAAGKPIDQAVAIAYSMHRKDEARAMLDACSEMSRKLDEWENERLDAKWAENGKPPR